MTTSVWTYAWDLHDLGLDAACLTLEQAGVDMVSLAVSYHAGRFLQPGNPRRRVCFPQDGTVYYRPRPAHWQGAAITPLVADIVATEGDQFAALLAQRAKGGPKVSAWTVCLHNTRLGMAHPDHAMRTAHGDVSYFGLCPSSPAARDYVVRLVAEVASHSPDRIEIESPDFMGFSHGYHHEKDGLPVLPEDDFLLGVCFCPHCQTRAQAAGIDARTAQTQARALLDAAFDRELPMAQFPDFPARGIDAFARLPALHAYLVWRHEPVTSLMAKIRAAVPPTVELLLIDHETSWWGGVDPLAIAPHVDGFVYCLYRTEPDRIAPLLSQVRAALGPGKTLIAGFLLFHPAVASHADLAAKRARAAPFTDGFAYYNLGLVPPKRLAWIKDA